jgi:hypothetical protein
MPGYKDNLFNIIRHGLAVDLERGKEILFSPGASRR